MASAGDTPNLAFGGDYDCHPPGFAFILSPNKQQSLRSAIVHALFHKLPPDSHRPHDYLPAFQPYLSSRWLYPRPDWIWWWFGGDPSVVHEIEKLRVELQAYVNHRVNKFSQIQEVIVMPQPFEKTATQKIKRYLYA